MRQAILTTSWDDGDPADLKLADMLAKYHLPATFYVPIYPRVSGKRLTDVDLREISLHFDIGAHTINHVTLTEQPDDLTRMEIIESKYQLEQLTGKSCHMFCPPLGRFHRHHLTYVAEAKFIGFRTVELMSTDYPRSANHHLIELPTSLQVLHHPKGTYIKNATKRLKLRNAVNALRFLSGADWMTTAERIISNVINRGGVFHLWGHSWEIEANNLWYELEKLFSLIRSVRSRFQMYSNTSLCLAKVDRLN